MDDEEAVVKGYKLTGGGFALLLAPLFFVSASLLKYGLEIRFLFKPLGEAIFSDPEWLQGLTANAYVALRL